MPEQPTITLSHGCAGEGLGESISTTVSVRWCGHGFYCAHFPLLCWRTLCRSTPLAGSNKKVIYAALIGNALIAVTKFIAAVFTNSSAMLSESIHSIVDTGNQVLLLYGLRRAKLPVDERYPSGHGKEVYFWSFIVAMLIFAVGAAVSIYKGIQHVIHPEPIASPMVKRVFVEAETVGQ